MSLIQVWIHYVWTTKYRKPILKEPYRSLLFQHIKHHAFEKNIFVDRINRYEEHVHAIVSLGSSQTIDGIAQILKGESSFWFNNKSGFKMPKLSWADKYFAASVSESMLPVLRAYVDRQVIHHQKKSFQEEYEEMMKIYGIKYLG